MCDMNPCRGSGFALFNIIIFALRKESLSIYKYTIIFFLFCNTLPLFLLFHSHQQSNTEQEKHTMCVCICAEKWIEQENEIFITYNDDGDFGQFIKCLYSADLPPATLRFAWVQWNWPVSAASARFCVRNINHLQVSGKCLKYLTSTL